MKWGAAFLVCMAVVVAPVPGVVDAPVQGATGTNYQEPYSWGARASGSSTIHGQYSAPVVGDTALSTTAPAGGGTLGARISDGAPVSKFAALSVFGGGTPLMFSRGAHVTGGTHVLLAVQNTAGAHEVWGWGTNTYGQLGNASTTSATRPVKASWTAGVGETILSLAVGERHSLMLTLQGATRRVYAWGSNASGQVGGAGLGVASTTKQTTPLLLSTLTAVAVQSIAAGQYHSVAADAAGDVWVWGADSASYGNIGLPGERPRYLPEKLTATSMGQRSATVTHYAIANNVATLTTSGYHYFEATKTATVNIGIPLLDGSKTIASVTNNAFTYTAQPNVASTAVGAGVADVTYTAPSAAVSSKRISGNSAYVTVPTGHNYKAGNIVTVNIGDSDFDGSRTLLSVSGTELRYQSQPDVASTPVSGSLEFTNPNATVVGKSVVASANAARLYLAAGHNLKVGNIINVNIGDTVFDGTRTISGSGTGGGYTYVQFTARPNVASTPVSPSGTITTVTPLVSTVTNRVMTFSGGTGTATLTVPVGHGFKVGNTINVAIGETAFDGGPYAVTAVGTSTVTYQLPASGAVSSGAVSGSVTLSPGTTTVTNKAITSNIATVTVPSGHGFAAGNVIDVADVGVGFDGRQTITAVTATTISFESQDDVSYVAASGTATIAAPTIAISNKLILANDATVTLPSGHGLAVGNTIAVSGLGGNFDGTKTVAAAGATTVTYEARSNVSATAVSGTVTMTTPTLSVTNKSITSNVATVTLGSGHGLAVGNTITVSGLSGNFDGAKTVTAVASTTISYKAQADVGTAAIGGTAVITDCTSSCPTVPSGVLEVAAGVGFTLARTAGSVLSWGFNSTNHYNRIGRLYTTGSTPLAVALPGGCTPTQLAAAPYGAAVLCANNSVVTWGNNREGQLGTGTPVGTLDRYTPTAISGVSLNSGETITSIDMSSSTGMVLTSQGRLFTWGSNKYRVLGTDKTYAGADTASTTPSSTSAVVATRIAPTGATIVSAMFEHYGGFVLDSNGAVWTWGYAGKSLTGRGVAGPSTTPSGARFYPLSTATSVRIALMDSTYWGMAAVMSDGSMWTMGSKGDTAGYYYNADGTSTSRFAIGRVDLPFGPDTAAPSESITQLSCGTYHCLIATSAGKIYGWGDSTWKNVVINGSTDITTPTLIASGLVNPRIAAGTWFSLYVDIGASGTGGTVYAYGANSNRRAVPQVATSPLTAATAVQDMIAPTGTPSDVVAISAGTAHAVALRADGTLMTWGSNKYGQLGNGTNSTTVYYAEPTLPAGKIAATVHAAGSHTIVRATDGTLVGWGSNLNNVLAGASSGSVLSPTNIAVGYTFSQIDTYGYDASAPVATAVGISTSGTVMSWGSNQYGQLGRTDRPAASSGPNLNSSVPVAVQTSDGSPLVNADKVLATGYWGAAFRTVASPQVPSAPLSVTADSPAASQIRAFWSPPATPRDLQGYIVEVSRSGSVVFRAGAGRGATSLVMAAPTLSVLNGQEHTLRVYAVNEAGESAASNAATATPVGVPSVPQNLTVTPRIDGLRVAFETPADLAGLPIVDYEVVATPTSGSAAAVTVPVGSSPYSVDLTVSGNGLVIDTSYVVTVRARNAQGYGPTATSSGVIPGRPTAPLNVAALGLSGAVRVSWDAPASNGGADIASYIVKVYADGGGSALRSVVVNSGLAPSMTATVSTLTDGTAYDVTVTASQDSSGAQYLGVESSRVDVIVGRPAAPTNVAAAAFNQPTGTQVRVTWTKVDDQTGITVTHYRVKYRISPAAYTAGSAIATGTACTGTSCAATITGLANGTEYEFVVEAGTSSTAWGLTSAASTATPIGITTAPGVDATSQDSAASVGITAPTSLNGSDVIRYELTYRPTSGGAWSTAVELQLNEFPYAISGLTNGTSYTVSVVAVNGAGASTAGTATVVPATTPGAPQNVRARPGSIIVTWDAPTDTGGATVTSYDIVVTDQDGVPTQFSTTPSNPTGTTACTTAGRSCTITQVFTGDSPDTLVAIPSDVEYTVTVTAVTSAGSGPPSSDSVLVSGQPDAPTNVVATAGFELFELCWTPPSGSVTAYKVSALRGLSATQREFLAGDAATSATCLSPNVGITITGWDDGSAIVAGATYSVDLVATYSASDYIYGVTSSSVTVTPYGLPGRPTISDISTTGSGTATITWSAAAPYGAAVSAYTAQTSLGEICVTAGTLSCTITGLTGNAAYSFSVHATNVAGDGPPSATVVATIDATSPTPVWGAPLVGGSRRASSTATFDEYVYYVLTFDEVVSGFSAADLSNAGTAGACTFSSTVVLPGRQFDIAALCGATGTLIARVAASSVDDAAMNSGPVLNVDSALVTLNDPSSTTTATPTTTTIVQTTTTGVVSAASTTTTLATGTTTTVAGDGSSRTTSPVSGGATSTTLAGGVGGATTTTTIGGGSGLPPTIDRRLKEDADLVDEDPVAVGKPVSVRRCGFDPGEVVRLYVGGNLVRTTTADADGCVEEEVVVPEVAGKKIVVALYAPASKFGVKTTIEVVERLVATGASVDNFVAGAFLALVTGAFLAAIPRRRRRQAKH